MYPTTAISVGKEDANNTESCTKIHRQPWIGFSLGREADGVRLFSRDVFLAVHYVRGQERTGNLPHAACERWSIECHIDVQTSVQYTAPVTARQVSADANGTACRLASRRIAHHAIHKAGRWM